MHDLKYLLIFSGDSIRKAMAYIDRNGQGIVLVVDEERRLLGTITDGDVRRATLTGQGLDAPVSELLAGKACSSYPKPVTAPVEAERATLLRLMQERVIRQVPLIDANERVAGLVTLDELLPDEVVPLQAVIMAGGHGTRLRPLTEDLPKPMLPVGDRPLIQLTIERLCQAGIRRVNIATHYLSEKITSYFGDGREFNIELNYVTEDRPLGTAGALGLMQPPNETLLVINGDIITGVNFRAMLTFHREHKADLTMAVVQYGLQVPYGVVECEGPQVRQVREKPLVRFLINGGIYLLEPSVYRYIPNGQHFDMPELIQRLLEEGRVVVSFPIVEYWLDIGKHTDYQQAQEDMKNGRFAT